MHRKKDDEDETPGPQFSDALMGGFEKYIVGVDWATHEFTVRLTARRLSRGFEIKEIKVTKSRDIDVTKTKKEAENGKEG